MRGAGVSGGMRLGGVERVSPRLYASPSLTPVPHTPAHSRSSHTSSSLAPVPRILRPRSLPFHVYPFTPAPRMLRYARANGKGGNGNDFVCFSLISSLFCVQ